jgi:hypothetical protein
MMNAENLRVMVASCKECGKEFEMRIPIRIYEAMLAASEEDGETLIFTGRCPNCQESDPFLNLLKEAGITTVGGLSRRIKR